MGRIEGWALATILALLATLAGPAGAAEPTGDVINFVETGDGRIGGNQPWMRLDTNGNPVIAYQESGTGIIAVAHCNDPYCAGGDETVSRPGEVEGSGPSMALDPAGNPVIAFQTADADLGLIRCDDPDCDGDGDVLVHPDAHPEMTIGQLGVWLELDASGNPVILYSTSHWTDGGMPRLKLLRCDDPFCAGVSPLDVLGGAAAYAELTMTLDGSGNPFIAYTISGHDRIYLTRCTTPDCSGRTMSQIEDTWISYSQRIRVVLDGNSPVFGYTRVTTPGASAAGLLRCADPACSDTTGGKVGAGGNAYQTWVVVDDDHIPIFVYPSLIGWKDLVVVRCTDPSCSEPAPYNQLDMGSGARQPMFELDPDGHPVIAYLDESLHLKLLHCDDPACDPLVGQVGGDDQKPGGGDNQEPGGGDDQGPGGDPAPVGNHPVAEDPKDSGSDASGPVARSDASRPGPGREHSAAAPDPASPEKATPTTTTTVTTTTTRPSATTTDPADTPVGGDATGGSDDPAPVAATADGTGGTTGGSTPWLALGVVVGGIFFFLLWRRRDEEDEQTA